MVVPLEAPRHSLLMKSCLCSTAAVAIRIKASQRRRTADWLSSCERRLPFLEMCRQPLFRVFTLKQELLQLPLDRETFEEAGFRARLHRALHATHVATPLVRRRE